jgi:8-oxo-dGTP pyrophosphatase MutT (NUDIX family)
MKPFDDESFVELRAMLDERPADAIEVGALRRACVVILLVTDPVEWKILFSQRSQNLKVHRGQMSFPGGSAHEDESLAVAALRELEEEVGVRTSDVELIGRLDDLITRTGFVVAPFVGVIRTKPEYALQTSEVDEIFEVPIRVLLDESNPKIRYLEYQGGRYPIYFYSWGDVVIWGLTGRILKAFLDLVRLTV